jgi:hypothetical protein
MMYFSNGFKSDVSRWYSSLSLFNQSFNNIYLRDESFLEGSSNKDVIPVFKSKSSEKFICKYCDQSFTVELALFKHYEQCSKKPAKFTCTNCGRDFRHEINLQKHISRYLGLRILISKIFA